MSSSTKTITFLGATGGCGLTALRRSVAAGHTCIALCRTPAKMEAFFPEKPANLIIKKGNAHDVADVASALTSPSAPGRLVDAVSFSIGGVLSMPKMTLDDPDVCKRGMAVLLEALAKLRADGTATGRPLIAVVSTTGISAHGRDVPLLFIPFYHWVLHEPHADKAVAEKSLFDSDERFVIVRPSLLVDGEKPDKQIRVHVEGRDGIEHKEIGYTISRQDIGRWMFENLFKSPGAATKYEGKAVGLTW